MEQHLLAATPGVTTAMTATFPCRAQFNPALKCMDSVQNWGHSQVRVCACPGGASTIHHFHKDRHLRLGKRWLGLFADRLRYSKRLNFANSSAIAKRLDTSSSGPSLSRTFLWQRTTNNNTIFPKSHISSQAKRESKQKDTDNFGVGGKHEIEKKNTTAGRMTDTLDWNLEQTIILFAAKRCKGSRKVSGNQNVYDFDRKKTARNARKNRSIFHQHLNFGRVSSRMWKKNILHNSICPGVVFPSNEGLPSNEN